MKRTNIHILVCTLLFAGGCNLFQLEDPRYLPLSQDTEVLREYAYVSHTATTITYDVKVSALARNDASFDYTLFLEEEFEFEGDGTFQITSFVNDENMTTSGNTSTILLIDQSGSYLQVDPYNNRSKGINKFLEDLSPNDFMLGGCSASGSLTS